MRQKLEVIAKVKEMFGKHAFTFIFANEKTGLPSMNIFYSWDMARKRAGLGYLRIHDLRHSFASFLVNAGRSLYEVQELLGHADSRTTTRYAHLSRERLREAVEVVPRVYVSPNTNTQVTIQAMPVSATCRINYTACLPCESVRF